MLNAFKVSKKGNSKVKNKLQITLFFFTYYSNNTKGFQVQSQEQLRLQKE